MKAPPAVKHAYGYVYALDDPRDGLPRYVGGTFEPWQRLQRHIFEGRRAVRRPEHAKLPRQRWLAELHSLGLEPRLEILERTPKSFQLPYTEEQAWIGKYRALYPGLLNTSILGRKMPKRPVQAQRVWLSCDGRVHERAA